MMTNHNSDVAVALITGIFGLLGAVISIVFWIFQSVKTNRLDRKMMEYQNTLETKSETQMRLYEKAIETISQYRAYLRETHLRLCDYKNSYLYDYPSKEKDDENTRKFYEAWNKLRFPSVYIPDNVIPEINKNLDIYQKLKNELYETGKIPDKQEKTNKVLEYNKQLIKIESDINNLMKEWKWQIIGSPNIMQALLGHPL